MKQLPNLIVLSLFLILFLFVYIFKISDEELSKSEERIAFCGTNSDRFGNANYEEIENGKNLFKNYCAQCHAKNMKSKATGPPLANFIMNWKNDTISVWQYLNNSSNYFNVSESKRLEILRKDYAMKGTSHNYNLSLQDTKNLIAYIGK